MNMPLSRLFNGAKNLAFQIVAEKTKKAILAALKAFLKKLFFWLLGILGPYILVFLLILVLFFAPVAGAFSTYNFTSSPYPDAKQDAKLKASYDKVSTDSVDADTINEDPNAKMYRVPWGVFAAIDKVKNNCEKPVPESYLSALKPIFHMKDSTITTTTTTTDTAGGYSQQVNVQKIKLINSVDTYQGTFRHNYVWSTTTKVSSHTETRTACDAKGHCSSYTVTVTVRVEVKKEDLSGIDEPTPRDYSRFLSALQTFGIKLRIDQELVYELTKRYAEEQVDVTQPVTELMGFSNTGLFGGGAPPPAGWIQYFKQAAARYHGNTDTNEFAALLMAICYTESSFSDSHSEVSSAGALGPMQFLPSTFQDYGVNQLGYAADDIWNPDKAIMTAALMLSGDGAANGSIGGIRKALWHYNQSVAYADLVVARIYYFAQYAGWTPTSGDILQPGSASTKGYYWPVPGFGTITDPFGPRIDPINHDRMGYHTGIDIAAPLLTPIIAPKDGVVEEVSYNDPIYGQHIYLRHDDQVETFYGHMETIMTGIVAGTPVKAGQIIALVGSRGRSTGPHLHFEVHYDGKVVNPLLFVNQP